jgi:hypothetical protein
MTAEGGHVIADPDQVIETPENDHHLLKLKTCFAKAGLLTRQTGMQGI